MVLIENFKPPIWHASIAFALAILWMAHLLNPYLILVRAFLFSAGFAFGSPAHSSVTAEMVSKDDLASAYTLAGMQMDLSGIIGPLFSALLLPLAGVSFIFGANGLGFLLMFLALLQWTPHRHSPLAKKGLDKPNVALRTVVGI